MVRDGGVQRRRVEELAELPPADRREEVDELAALLSADSAYVRGRAMDLLVDLSAEYPGALTDAVDEVAGLLGDDALGDGAARVLGNLAAAEPGAVADRLPLLVAVIDSGGAVTEGVTAALAAIGADSPGRLAQPGIVEQLVGLLDADSEAVRVNVTGVLGDVAGAAPDAVVDAGAGLRDRLADDSPAVQRNAAYALGQLAPASPGVAFDATEDLCGLLESPEPDVRAAAAHALGATAAAIGVGDDALPAVVDRLDADTPVVRRHAAFVLAEVAGRDPDAVRPHLEALARGMIDSDPAVRRNLGHALATLEPELPDAVEEATAAASEWLGSLDPEESADVSPEGVRGLATDGNAPPELRRAARNAVVLGGQHPVGAGTEADAGRVGTGADAGSAVGQADTAGDSDGSRSCPECGETFEPDATFCAVCGASLE